MITFQKKVNKFIYSEMNSPYHSIPIASVKQVGCTPRDDLFVVVCSPCTGMSVCYVRIYNSCRHTMWGTHAGAWYVISRYILDSAYQQEYPAYK